MTARSGSVFVIPAQAGIQSNGREPSHCLDRAILRLRRNAENGERHKGTGFPPARE